jgi:hypothetical protein
MNKNPSPTPPHKGEGLTCGDLTRRKPASSQVATFRKLRGGVTRKPLPLVGRGWGGVFFLAFTEDLR